MQTKNFVFLGDEEVVSAAINAGSLNMPTPIVEDNIHWSVLKSNETEVRITTYNENESIIKRTQIFTKSQPKAVFVILKAPQQYAGVNSHALKNDFERHLSTARNAGLSQDIPVFVVLTGVSEAVISPQPQATNLEKVSKPIGEVLFNFEKASFGKEEITVGSFKSSNELFRRVFYLPVEKSAFSNLLFTGTNEKDFKRFVYRIIAEEALQASTNDSEGSKNSNAQPASKGTVIDTTTVTSTTKSITTKKAHGSNQNNQGVVFTVTRTARRLPQENKPSSKKKKSDTKPLTKESSTEPSKTLDSPHHTEKTDVKNEVVQAGSNNLRLPFSVASDSKTTIPTFQNDSIFKNFPVPLEIAGKVGLTVFIFGALIGLVIDAMSNGAFFAMGAEGILYNLLPSIIFVGTPPAWFVMVLFAAALLITSVIIGAIAGGISFSMQASEKKSQEAANQEDVAPTEDKTPSCFSGLPYFKTFFSEKTTSDSPEVASPLVGKVDYNSDDDNSSSAENTP